ncbi:alpha/beta hydrolase [Sphingomonas sp. NBWT7]|uniref:alpha/beta fold hydrolase n=1 Tax=Sphingomonas sp. NBWT7 TaxID=2596913 RepID=UPI001624E0DB|nr:alpha/beta hydrolase [Sphingomonas sp. NBWT7]QNE31726.1 alpha/beta hydrolase [Sphingomonas sp. NBWT7]
MTDPVPIRRAIPVDATVTRWAAPDGWQLRRFDWPAAGDVPRGGILFQGGRGDVFEKYLESFAHWHDQGWTIAAFDWRGQGGSGRLSPDPHVGHAIDFAPWIADLAAFWRDWDVAGPRVAMGHSMGGHLVLRALLEEAIDPAAAVLIAPMLGLKSPVGAGVAERVARLMRRIGDPARPAWKGHERPGARLDRRTLLTADQSRYDDEQYWYEEVPEIKLGPPSWAWLAEAFASTRAQRGDPRLATIKTPLLMLIADADGLVDSRAAVALAARLPTAQVVRFGRESAHEILREADPVRDRALAAIDAFLTAHAR